MAYYILKSYKLKLDPFLIFQALAREKNCFFLDSSLSSRVLGRYSFIGADPFYHFEIKGDEPFSLLRQMLARYQITIPKCAIPFLGGAVGYFGYDLGVRLEHKVCMRAKEGIGIPDYVFNFYNTCIAIDARDRKLYIFAAGFPEKKYHLAHSLCRENFKRMYALLAKIVSGTRPLFAADGFQKELSSTPTESIQSNFKKEEYLDAVKKAKEYIRRGDIYQVNLSQRFRATSALAPVQLYGRLRDISPTCFSGYFDAGDFQILSASPERFLHVKGSQVSTRPMKGTRGRCARRRDNEKLKKELWRSEKDKAELTMIVDLERNDLGRVCEYGSVRVKTMRQLETYATVFQTTATVQGDLHHSKDRIDLLRACFPGGSITGCPKIRAMQIIEELEPVRRSLYTGCFGYVSFSGSMDLNVLIRTILKKGRELYFGVGGGIVADSQPEAEYEETLVKAHALMRAIGLQRQGR